MAKQNGPRCPHRCASFTKNSPTNRVPAKRSRQEKSPAKSSKSSKSSNMNPMGGPLKKGYSNGLTSNPFRHDSTDPDEDRAPRTCGPRSSASWKRMSGRRGARRAEDVVEGGCSMKGPPPSSLAQWFFCFSRGFPVFLLPGVVRSLRRLPLLIHAQVDIDGEHGPQEGWRLMVGVHQSRRGVHGSSGAACQS